MAITAIRDRLNPVGRTGQRREAILKSLEERELLTDDLKEKILTAETMATLEDIYLPFRPKRARGRPSPGKRAGAPGRHPFRSGRNGPCSRGAAFVDPEKGVSTAEEALAGARDIIAEWISEDQRPGPGCGTFLPNAASFARK